MVRENKVAGIANSIPDVTTVGPDEGDVLILGWGSTRGPIAGAVRAMEPSGKKVSGCCLRYINPFPNNLGDLMKRFKRVLIPELNRGQLSMLIRNKYLIDATSYTKVQGLPFYTDELVKRVDQILEELQR